MNPTNSHSHETLTPRDLLEYLATGHHALVLRMLQQAPANEKSELAERCDEIASSAVSRTVNDHRKRALVRDHPGRGYEITGFGESLLEIYDDFAAAIGPDGVHLVAKSASIIPMLHYLEEESRSLSALAAVDSIPGGRTTIGRRRIDLENAGWIVRTPQYEPSATGRVVMEAHSLYVESVARLIDRSELRVVA